MEYCLHAVIHNQVNHFIWSGKRWPWTKRSAAYCTRNSIKHSSLPTPLFCQQSNSVKAGRTQIAARRACLSKNGKSRASRTLWIWQWAMKPDTIFWFQFRTDHVWWRHHRLELGIVMFTSFFVAYHSNGATSEEDQDLAFTVNSRQASSFNWWVSPQCFRHMGRVDR